MSYLDNLPYQRGLIAFLATQKLNPEWSSHLTSLKKGTLKFLLNSSINSLPTQNNLKLWGLSSSDKYKLCHCRDSTLHLLSGCKIALDQGHYTWQHNSVLNHILSFLKDSPFLVT